MLNFKLKIILYKILELILLTIILLCGSASHAGEKEDQAFAQWKARQVAQDARLKQQADDNYYLSRPSVNESLSKKTVKSSAKSVNVGKINLNSASAQQLQQLNGVGAKKAEAIVEYRNQHGSFKSIEELQKVKGIGPKLFDKNKAQLSL